MVWTHGGREPRIRLTPLTVDDADEMAALLGDARLYEFTGGTAPSPVELRERYERQVVGRSPDGAERWLNWIVRQVTDNTAIGYVQATVIEDDDGPVAHVAWVIGVDYQGRGYATEAVAAMCDLLRANGVRAFAADIHPDHVASRRVAVRLGLRSTAEVFDGETRWRSERRGLT